MEHRLLLDASPQTDTKVSSKSSSYEVSVRRKELFWKFETNGKPYRPLPDDEDDEVDDDEDNGHQQQQHYGRKLVSSLLLMSTSFKFPSQTFRSR